ncbi:golgin subfamily A member 5-like isoform X1 [Periplaneta americana]|uniref:golgin subfamily A member 5-like isoform X1 n=1 Tax=Periplaneta americana TaxID=6978 RepID=UPI0037E96927
MSWLKGLAGKAEDFLNQIDQNAAVALQKEKREADAGETLLTDVTWEGLGPKGDTSRLTPPPSSTRSSPSQTMRSPKSNSDDELIKFLNSPEAPTPDEQQKVFEVCSPVAESRKFSPVVAEPDAEAALQVENGLLKNELRSLNGEMSLLLRRAKASEQDNWNLQQQLTTLQVAQKQALQSLEEQVVSLEGELANARQQTVAAQDLAQGLQLENARLLQDSNGHQNLALQALQDELQVHRQQAATLVERTASLEQQHERARAELGETRTELEQYRMRAQRILQDKERLIAELRGRSTPDDGAAGTELELAQLRAERDLLREEATTAASRLRASRDELAEMEKRLETGREQAAQALQRLQDGLQEERRRRQAAEEDCRAHAEELRALRDDLARGRDRELELERLRDRLAQRPSSPAGSELEARLHALTQALVQKQAALETATTEKNALRLQLERAEHRHRDALALLQSGVNDTDDAKARVPSFLVESPFDTGVARRVKRAYSSLDAVSIRTGVFLRRYPLARILVLCYMVLLHLWVMVVLLSYTP